MDRRPAEWCELTGITIMDPDGWRGRMADKKITDPISREEFLYRAGVSTVKGWPMPLHDELKPSKLVDEGNVSLPIESQEN